MCNVIFSQKITLSHTNVRATLWNGKTVKENGAERCVHIFGAPVLYIYICTYIFGKRNISYDGSSFIYCIPWRTLRGVQEDYKARSINSRN
jgi:hypothetical protein